MPKWTPTKSETAALLWLGPYGGEGRGLGEVAELSPDQRAALAHLIEKKKVFVEGGVLQPTVRAAGEAKARAPKPTPAEPSAKPPKAHPGPPTPIALAPKPRDEDAPVSSAWKTPLSKNNKEKLTALAEAYGITEDAALNVCVSEQYDTKVANLRDAEEGL